jgi:hypothetical protein
MQDDAKTQSPNSEEIVSKLKVYEQQSLSYYQATQNLLKLGYDQTQIDDANDEYKYTEPSNVDSTASIEPGTKLQKDSLDEDYDKVGNVLLKDSAKDNKPPSFWTLWAPSTYGLKVERNIYFMKYSSGRLSIFLITLIVSLILTIATYNIFSPQATNNSQYCNYSTNVVTAGCVSAEAISYGFPVHGAYIKYEVQERVIGSETDTGVDLTNFGIFFISIWSIAFLSSKALTRL